VTERVFGGNILRKLKLLLNYLTFLVCLIIPKKKNRWVFGAWFGNRISDNPYALYQYIVQNHPDIDAYWLCNDLSLASELGVRAVKRNSFKGNWICLTSKVAVMNQSYLDLAEVNWIHRCFKVQLWHGVAWKKIGEDMNDNRSGLVHKISHKAFLFANRCDMYIAPSDESRKTARSAFLTDDEKILSAGQPRNEILLDEARCNVARNRLLSRIGNVKNIILYMPTFRDNSSDIFSFESIAELIYPVLNRHDAVILEKQHYVQSLRESQKDSSFERIINVADYDTQELLAASDILVTDYSSCFFDYILRDRPVVHYLYDVDSYSSQDRGLYYSVDYATAGKIVKNETELAEHINSLLEGACDEASRRKIIRERFDTFESKDNSRIIVQEVLKRI